MQISETDVQSPASRPRLMRGMGLWMAIALVIGNMVGSGIFLLPSRLAAAAGAERGRGRGGPRCMSCPIERDALTDT